MWLFLAGYARVSGSSNLNETGLFALCALDLQHRLLRLRRLAGVLCCAYAVLCGASAGAQSILDAPQPAPTSFIIGPLFQKADAAAAAQQGSVPARAVQPLLRGVIIVPDVSFVGMEQADIFFDFLHENVGSSVIAIGFNDLDKRPILQVTRHFIGQSLDLDTLTRVQQGVAAQAKQTPAYVFSSVYVPKQNAAAGVVYVVVKKSGLGVRDLNQARVFDGALIPPPAVKGVFAPLLAEVAPDQDKALAASASVSPPPPDEPAQTFIPAPAAKPIMAMSAENDAIMVNPAPEAAVTPAPPPARHIQGFILVVDQSFVGMEDLRVFYDFLSRTQGQTQMAVGIDPHIEHALTPILKRFVGQEISAAHIAQLITEAEQVLPDPTAIEIIDQGEANAVLYAVLR